MTGMSRVDEMLELQYKERMKVDTVVLNGKHVAIYTKYNNPSISGVFVGEMRPYEWSRDKCLVVQIKSGVLVFIKREDIAYIEVSELGTIAED